MIEWVGVLVEEFGFPPDYWRRMSWVEFLAWQELARKRRLQRLAAAANQRLALERRQTL